ncbi:hypothetical protein V6Z12_D09G178000 [Gossypium hirsutum]
MWTASARDDKEDEFFFSSSKGGDSGGLEFSVGVKVREGYVRKLDSDSNADEMKVVLEEKEMGLRRWVWRWRESREMERLEERNLGEVRWCCWKKGKAASE